MRRRRQHQHNKYNKLHRYLDKHRDGDEHPNQPRRFLHLRTDDHIYQWNTETYSPDNFSGATFNISATGSTTNSIPLGSSTPNCTYSGENGGSAAPFPVGQTWDNSYTRTCNGTTLALTNKGSIVSTESVTVPAGTFNAYKARRSTRPPASKPRQPVPRSM